MPSLNLGFMFGLCEPVSNKAAPETIELGKEEAPCRPAGVRVDEVSQLTGPRS